MRTARADVAALLAVVLAALAGATWWAWLGWDTTYYTDPATGYAAGYAAGPYRPWQVVGCVLTLLVLAVAGYLVLRPWLVGLAMTVGFTVGFATTALPGDESGLAGVGVVLVAVGMLLASLVLGLAARLVRRRLERRRA